MAELYADQSYTCKISNYEYYKLLLSIKETNNDIYGEYASRDSKHPLQILSVDLVVHALVTV